LTRYERALRAARAEGYSLLEQERTAAMKEREARIQAVRDEIARLVADEKQAIAGQVETARGSLQVDARSLAAEISSQILRRRVSEPLRSS
jgi:F0F1-type ATP synthase membrane subunit b/b'